MGLLGAGADAVGKLQDWGMSPMEAPMPPRPLLAALPGKDLGVSTVVPWVQDPPPTTSTVLGTDIPAQGLWPQ